MAAVEAELAGIEQQLDEKREEQSGEEGLLAEVMEGEGEKQKITAKAVKARLKEIGRDPDYAEEREALEDYCRRASSNSLRRTGGTRRHHGHSSGESPLGIRGGLGYRNEGQGAGGGAA